MLVYLRHGATSLNKGGDQERLRGWLSVPLSAKGILQAKDQAIRLRNGLKGPPDSFQTSDLHRALQTSALTSRAIGMDARPDSRIRDWNTGDLAGEKVTDVLPTLQHYINNPDEPTPNGEALNTYRQRFEPYMRSLVDAPGVHLVTGHARGATILEGIADPEGGVGGDVAARFLLARPRVNPGGILIINKNWQTKIDNPLEDIKDE